MRGRIAGVGVAAMALMAMVAALGAPAASAACPNEAFRTGPSALLSECRAYEQVTPVDKGSGAGVAEQGGALVGSSGDDVYFNSLSAFGDPQGSLVYNPYIAVRGADAWDARPVGGPQTGGLSAALESISGVFDDLQMILVASKEALTPGAIPFGSNLYVRDERTGAYTLVAALPGEQAFTQFTQSPIFFGASTDGSRILIGTNQPLTPDSVEARNLYEFHEGRLRLAVAGGETAGIFGVNPNLMSADGSRFFFYENNGLYLNQLGREPLLVSAGIEVEGNAFIGATPDDGIALFRSREGVLYRFEAAAPEGSRVTELTPPVGPENEPPSVIAASSGEDGTTVYFAAKGLLTPDAEPRAEGNGYDLYVWHGEPGQAGEIRYIGKSEDPGESFSALEKAQASPDGRYFGFEAFGKLTPDAVDGPAGACTEGTAGRCRNVFLYSFDADRLVCVTCSGSPPAGNSRLGGTSLEASTRIGRARAVLDDGMVLFDTPNVLSPRDANGVRDAYAWRDDAAQLISGGTDPHPSAFIGASPDGSNVFFETEGQLIGQDIDSLMDLYDARVEGGLPQAGAPLPSPCLDPTGCRGGISLGTTTPDPTSAAVNGARNVAGACLALRHKARASKRRSHALARRAKRAKGAGAKALRKRSAREAKAARRIGRRAGTCAGGGR